MTKSQTFTFLRVGIALVLLAQLCFSGAINWASLVGLTETWPLAVFGFVVVLLDTGLTGWRLSLLMRPRGLRLSITSAFRLSLIGNFFSIFLPGATGGDAVRIYYTSVGNQGRRAEVATIVVLDRAVGLFAMLVFPLLVVPFFRELLGSSAVFPMLLWFAAAAAGFMLLAFLAAFSSRLRHSRLLVWLLRRMPLGSLAERILETVYSYRENVGILLAAVGVSLVCHALAVGIVMVVAAAVTPGSASWEMVALIPMGFLANAIPLTPGGLGVGEAALDRLFTLAGLSGGAEALLGWRVLLALSGLLGLGFFVRGQHRFIHSAEPSSVQEDQPVSIAAAR